MTIMSQRPKAFTEPLPGEIVDQLVRRANEGAPKEVCGFIMYTTGMFILPCTNDHRDPEHYWNISVADLERVYENEENIVGLYHSHPNGPPRASSADIKYAPEGIRYFVVTTTHVIEWDCVNDKEIR